MLQTNILRVLILAISGNLLTVSPLYANDLGALSNVWKRSYSLEVEGRYRDALDAIRFLTESSEVAEYAFMRCGWLSYAVGDYSKAVDFYHSALRLNPNSRDAVVGMVTSLLVQRRYNEAEVHIRWMLEQDPHHYQINLSWMEILDVQREWAKLKAVSSAQTKHNSSAVDAWVFLARAERGLDSNQGAVTAYRQVLWREPDHSEALQYLTVDALKMKSMSR